MSKRGENIRKRADGRWEARFSVIDAATGKRKSKSVYAKTYTDVKAKLAEAKCGYEKEVRKKSGKIQSSDAEKPSIPLAESDILLTDAAAAWLLEISKSKKHSTYIKYKGIYEKYLAVKFKGKSLTDISGGKAAVSHWDIRFTDENLSDSLLKSVYCVLNQILAYCITHYHIDIRLAARPKTHAAAKPIKTLAQSEQIRLLQEIYTDMNNSKLGILLCLSTGLRLGEICALKWSDMDLDGKLLYVNRTVQRIAVDNHSAKTSLLEDTPKSPFSKREIPLPDSIIPCLLSFRQSNGYVISKDGPMEPRTYQYRFQRLLTDAGVGKYNFHILRHTFATNCINSGSDIKSLSEILGHSSVNITLNRYVHPTIDTKRKHLNNLSSVYSQYVE